MRKNVDYNLLIAAERIRYSLDFSSAHWLHQVIAIYEMGIDNKLCREAYEAVLRATVSGGIEKGIALAESFPKVAGFSDKIEFGNPENWPETKTWINKNFDQHVKNRFKYVREGD